MTIRALLMALKSQGRKFGRTNERIGINLFEKC